MAIGDAPTPEPLEVLKAKEFYKEAVRHLIGLSYLIKNKKSNITLDEKDIARRGLQIDLDLQAGKLDIHKALLAVTEIQKELVDKAIGAGIPREEMRVRDLEGYYKMYRAERDMEKAKGSNSTSNSGISN